MSSRAGKARRAKHTRAPLFAAIGVLFAVVVLSVSFVAGGINLMRQWSQDLPDVEGIESYAEGGITRVYASDRTTLLAELYLENREAVDYDEVSPYVYQATVATEDERFYEHNGFDTVGIVRAFFVNMASGSTSEGASTITQQLVRNTLLIDEMNEISMRRKVREIELAVEAEKTYTKDEILLMYCNTVNYGDGAYGIQAAAMNYFSKNAADLTLSESALLAGIPQSPTRLNPFTNFDAAIERRNVVLSRMLSNGFITQEEYDQAVAEEVVLNKTDREGDGIYQQPYFVNYVKSVLQENYSASEIFQGGLTVYTTLDLEQQALAEQTVENALEGEADDIEIALLSMEPDTGHIVAMVGGKDYYSDQYNLATQAQRQCGSSFKSFTLCTAIEMGMSPSTYFNGSSPMQVTDDWKVSNNDGVSYSTVTLAKATNLSLNTVYAQLAIQLGPDAIIEMAHRLGITSELESVPSVTLGTQGVTVLEMTDAYATFATGGVQRDPVCITEILNSTGEQIFVEEDNSEQAISKEVAYAVTRVLEDDLTEGTSPSAYLGTGQVCAGKTGTTQNNRDAYFVGYTPQLCTAIWVGTRQERDGIYFNGSTLGGGNACAPIWRQFMVEALEKYEQRGWVEAEDPEYTLENTSEFRPGYSTSYSSSSSGSYSSRNSSNYSSNSSGRSYSYDDDDEDYDSDSGTSSSGNDDSDSDSGDSGGTDSGGTDSGGESDGADTGGDAGGGDSGADAGGDG